MGACDAISHLGQSGMKNNSLQNKNFPANNGINQSYKFDCNERKILNKNSLNLHYIFSQIKIKHCISHSPKKVSTYIVQISIGQKKFKLNVIQGKNPNIDDKIKYDLEKEFKLKELEEILFSIDIYEFTDQININNFSQLYELPEENKKICKYSSFFKMDLLSFLFKSKKCDFKMNGNNQLSANTRISFVCEIEHKERIKITVKSDKNTHFSNLAFRSKNINDNSNIGTFKNSFTLETPLITMKEFQKADLFLESNENEAPYHYTTLNDLKFSIIKKLGENILKEQNDYIKISLNSQSSNDTDYNTNSFSKNNSKKPLSKSANPGIFFLFDDNSTSEIKSKMSESKKDINLTVENLPIISQISSLYFTEYGHLYNTAILNILNNDNELINYRKTSKISSEDFYKRLMRIIQIFNSGRFDFNRVFNELNDILKRSIDNEKYYFLYPNLDSLYKMITLLMNIGNKIIEFIQMGNEEEKIKVLIKSLNYLAKREELDNGVLYYCLSNYNTKENTLNKNYNIFFINLLKLNEICKKKNMPNINISLIDLYSKLYFKKKYVRQAIFRTLFNNNMSNDKHQIDIFIYDITNDEKLNRYLDQGSINQIVSKQNYFSNLFKNGNSFFKSIIINFIYININEFPLDFSLFVDNQNILDLIGRYIKNKRIENLGNEVYELALLLSDSYETINKINYNIIKYTNGYNNSAVFKLFDYLKNLLDYNSSKEKYKLIMDYSLIEQAINGLIKIDHSITLPKIFWFYYCCSHLILTGNLKFFIINLCNYNFDKFAFHWSFTIRQIFFKVIFYILNDRLKNEEGKLFNQKNMNGFANKNVKNKLYNTESIKDYDTILNEYQEWKAVNIQNKEYPLLYLPLMNGDNID